MTLRRGLTLAGLAVWLALAAAWAIGVEAQWLAYALAAVTLLLAFEVVTRLSQRVQAWRRGNRDA